MVFYIILGLVIVGSIIGFIWGCMDDGPLADWLLALMIGAFAGALLLAPFALTPGSVQSTETHSLRAMATSDGVSGKFFPGMGYVGSIMGDYGITND